ncbi:MAG: inositol monophosphatase family protein [Geminicoccaceae bacterium]
MFQSMAKPAASLLAGVTEAVLGAGSMIRTEFHRSGGPRVQGGKATIDIEVEQLLQRRLLALRACNFLGEETAPDGELADEAWVVDPQDGTSEFLRGRRGSAVSVALLRAGRPVLGVVHAPLAPDDDGDLIAWAEGAALTRNGRGVRPSGGNRPPLVALNADAADHERGNRERLPGLRVRALPSPAYRLALTAAGEVDAGISLTRGLAPWDIAGGHALLTGAGMILTDGSGRAIDYDRRSFDGCIGGPAPMVERILASPPRRSPGEPCRPAQPRRRVADAAMLSRAQGCLLGQIAGDALGSAVEFRTAADIRRSHPRGVTTLEDGGTWDLIAGQPTDDGELALALARTLVARGGFDAAEVGGAYVAWSRSGPFDIGGTTADGIAAIATGRPLRSESQSNGALMRVSPIGLLAAGDRATAARLAADDARLTHPHPVCQSASAALAAAIAVGVKGGEADEMSAAAHAAAEAEAVRERLVAARTRPPDDYQRQMGWVLTALHNAFYWLMRGAPLAEAVVATVARGGDTDTNGAVCGALLGSLQGREAVPLQWRNAVLTCRPVRAAGVRHPRPPAYWPDDVLDLAEALLVAASCRSGDR